MEYVELLILAPTIVPGIAVVLGIHSVFRTPKNHKIMRMAKFHENEEKWRNPRI